MLRLSDFFADGPEGACVEVTATVLNINEGHNAELLEACQTLAGYAHFVALTRVGLQDGLDSLKAVEYAIDTCIREGVLADFLRQNRAEVVDMFLEEWDEEKYRDLIRRETAEVSWADGRAKGLEEGRAVGLAEGREAGHAEVRAGFLDRAVGQVRSGALSLEEAVSIFGFSEDDIRTRL